MEIKASLDVGDNVKELIEKLASTVGTTADKLYPKYVAAVRTEALIELILFAVMWAVGLGLLVGGTMRRETAFDDKGDGCPNPKLFILVAGGSILFVCFIASGHVPEWFVNYQVPEVLAAKRLMADAAALVRGR